MPRGLIHHSDRGVQYACSEAVERLEQAGVQIEHEPAGLSVGQCHGGELHADTEEGGSWTGRCYRDLADAQASRSGSFIEDIYNSQRLHLALD